MKPVQRQGPSQGQLLFGTRPRQLTTRNMPLNQLAKKETRDESRPSTGALRTENFVHIDPESMSDVVHFFWGGGGVTHWTQQPISSSGGPALSRSAQACAYAAAPRRRRDQQQLAVLQNDPLAVLRSQHACLLALLHCAPHTSGDQRNPTRGSMPRHSHSESKKSSLGIMPSVPNLQSLSWS